jgi:DNA replication protein DnaC
VGKTHPAIALGYLATQKDYKTRFFSTAKLMLEAASVRVAIGDASRGERLPDC